MLKNLGLRVEILGLRVCFGSTCPNTIGNGWNLVFVVSVTAVES